MFIEYINFVDYYDFDGCWISGKIGGLGWVLLYFDWFFFCGERFFVLCMILLIDYSGNRIVVKYFVYCC